MCADSIQNRTYVSRIYLQFYPVCKHAPEPVLCNSQDFQHVCIKQEEEGSNRHTHTRPRQVNILPRERVIKASQAWRAAGESTWHLQNMHVCILQAIKNNKNTSKLNLRARSVDRVTTSSRAWKDVSENEPRRTLPFTVVHRLRWRPRACYLPPGHSCLPNVRCCHCTVRHLGTTTTPLRYVRNHVDHVGRCRLLKLRPPTMSSSLVCLCRGLLSPRENLNIRCNWLIEKAVREKSCKRSQCVCE